MVRPLHQQKPHAARRGMNQHHVARRQLAKFVQQVMRRHPLQGKGGALLEAKTRRQRNQPVGLHQTLFRVRARLAGVSHASARRDVAHAFAHRLHHAASLAARNEGQLHRVAAAALIDLDEVHAHGRDAHQRLAGTWLANRHLFQFQHFRAARLLDLNRLQGVPPFASATLSADSHAKRARRKSSRTISISDA